ncbi:MAG: hypothetical protein HRT65_15060 [Flavobacteriaceae bacterium]|nr:hypothetical protein [Flavobacteriaceae bacterium]
MLNPNAPSIHQKSQALCDLSQAVASYFSKQNDVFKRKRTAALRDDIANSIATDALLLPATLRKVQTSDSIRALRHHVAFVNTITKNILSYCNGLEKDGIREREYVGLLRKEIYSFRTYFKQWRSSFLE